MELRSWVHCGYRTSIATIPICRDKPGWYTEHVKHIELSKNSRLGRVVLIGDDFFERLANFPKVWSKYFGPLQTLNYGLRGDRTQHVLWRVETGALPVNAEVVVIHAGANNLLYDHSRDVANGIGCIALMCLKHKPSARIFLTGLIPFDGNRKKKIKNINRYLKLLCTSGHISNCFYVKPDEHWLNNLGTINTLFFSNGLSEDGMDKFSKPITDTISNSSAGVEIEMSSGSDISTDEDIDNFSVNAIFSKVKSKLDASGNPQRRLRKRQKESPDSTTPPRIKSKSLSTKSKSPHSKENKRRHSQRSKSSSSSRSSSSSSSDSRPISPVITAKGRRMSRSRSKSIPVSPKEERKGRGRRRSRSKSNSRPISPVNTTRSRSKSSSKALSPYTARRNRSKCRSRSGSTSKTLQRERWIERAKLRVTGVPSAKEPFELISTWSASRSGSPSPRHSPKDEISAKSLKISITYPLPKKGKATSIEYPMTSSNINPRLRLNEGGKCSLQTEKMNPTLPEQKGNIATSDIPPTSTSGPDPVDKMYDKFLEELEQIKKINGEVKGS